MTAGAPAGFTWPATPGRWPRSLRRWGTQLVRLNIPRGCGTLAAAALILASLGYGTLQGGHGPEIAADVQDACDAVANAFGFRISEIALSGDHQLGREQILAAAGITANSSLLFLDPARTRARLMANPWIAEATVLKLYPGRLRIEIKERTPFALWQKDGKVALIATDGTVLEQGVPARFAGMPLVVGQGAERAAPQLLALVAHFPTIAHDVKASVFVAQRRWTLYLKSGVEVLLPENDPAQALTTLVDLDRSRKLLSRDIVMVDLRLSDRVTVRQSDAAAAARDAAIKARDKAKKKKGSEA